MKLGRAFVAAAAALTMALPTTSAAQAAPGAPEAPGGVALTWAPLYMSSEHQYSPAEAVALAKQFDILAAMPIAFDGEVAAMKQANPGLTILSYANATFLDDNHIAGVPESEYARDTAGRKIRSAAFGNYLMEPSNPSWRARSIAMCRDRANSAGYDGCLLDMLTMGIFSRGYVSSLPRVPGGATYTQPQWRDQLIRLARQFRTDDPGHVHVGNAVSNESRYWDREVPSRPLVNSMPAAQMEDFLRGSADATTRFPSPENWRGAVDVIRDMEAQGTTGLFTTKLWSNASGAQVAQWQKYAMASFLMGANGNSYFAFTHSRDKAGATQANAPYRMPRNIGAPTGAMRASGAAYVRDFQNGKSVVNPTSGTVTVDLGVEHRTLDGRIVRTLTLPANSGDVVLDPRTPASGPVNSPDLSQDAPPATAPDTVVDTAVDTAPTTPDTPAAAPVVPAETPVPAAREGAPSGTLTSPTRNKVAAGSIGFSGTAADTEGIKHVGLAVLNRNTGQWLQADGTWGRYTPRPVSFTRAKATTWTSTLQLPAGRYWVGLVVIDNQGNKNSAPRPGIALTAQ